MITVESFAKVLREYDIVLVAGEAGQHMEIKYCNIQENPLKSSRIEPYGFMMSTFYGFQSVEQIVEHLAWYVEIKISAVGFHTLKYRTIPEEVIRFANQASLPLLSIPKDMPYNPILDKFNQLQQQLTLKNRDQADKVNETILEGVLIGRDAQYIIQTVGEYLQTTVIYLDDRMNIVSSWSDTKIADSELARLISDLKQNRSQLLVTNQSASSPIETCIYQADNSLQPFTVYPLIQNLDLYGYLLVGTIHQESAIRQSIIKNALRALLLHETKRNATKEYHKNEDIKLFESIFQQKTDKQPAMEDFYYRVSAIKQLVLVESLEADRLRDSFFILRQLLKEWDPHCLLWIFERRIVCLLQIPITAKTLQKNKSLTSFVSIGVSDKLEHHSPVSFKRAYEQAIVSLAYARQKGDNPCFWQNLGVEKITYSLANSPALNRLDEEVLAPLLDYDRQNGTDFVYTLYIYLCSFFSLKHSGDVLYLHPNTIKYRINKIQEILGVDVTDPDQYVLLQVALRLHFGKQEGIVSSTQWNR